jgi:hypothetical protein
MGQLVARTVRASSIGMGRFRLSSQPVPESRNRCVNLIRFAEHMQDVTGVN